jgi:hypothetical protein
MTQEISKKSEKITSGDRWYIRDVDAATKKIIRKFAFDEEIKVGEALKIIVAEWKAKKQSVK